MEMIPTELSLRTSSAAEKKLFNQLSAVEIPGLEYALHSLNLSEHLYKEMGEIDFLLVGSRGLFVLEVKGGGVACRDGVWIFTDRYGNERRKSEGPFGQARTAMFSLLDRLRDLGGENEVRQATHGYGVVFPDQIFDQDSVEWSSAMVLDEPRLREPGGLKRHLAELVKYWEEKRQRSSRLDGRSVQRLLQKLRPEFDLVPTLEHTAREIDERLTALTEQQYRYLHAAGRNPRLLCSGGAGTGKTFLAAEVARREAAAERRVLVTCASPIFAAFLRRQLEDTPVQVAAMVDVRSHSDDSYDTLIVDEGQDLINGEDLGTLDRLLAGGLDGGRWRIFYDVNNQSGLVGSFDEAAFSLLLDTGPTELELPDNCRNTRRIIDRTRLVTGADVGVTTAGEGPAVKFWFHPDRKETARALEEHLDELVGQGVPTSDMAILTGTDPADSAASLLSAKWRSRLAPLDTTTALVAQEGHVVLARIADFKGLERPFVAVVDIDRLDAALDVAQVYVGMTRARAGLWISVDERLRERVSELVDAHAARFAEGR